MTLQYSSGSTTNALAWSDDAGIIAAGNTDAGADDAAGALHTVTFTMTASKAGESTLVFGARDAGKAPRLDKLTITLEKGTEPEPSEPSYDALNAAIDEAEALTETDYTADSWAKVEAALAAAKAALESTDQDTIDAAAKALNDAVDALVEAEEPVTVDKSKLYEAIARYGELSESDYTAESWQRVEMAYADAETALSSDDQAEIDAAVKGLNDAIDALEKAEEPEPAKPDTTELQAAIDAAEALTESDYTADSWAEVESALAAAKAALGSTDQKVVDAAAKALNDAVEALVEAEPEPEPVKPDTSGLQAAIDDAEALKADDYTAESWEAFQEALAAAQAVLGDPEATQADVDSALDALGAAKDALVESEPSDPGTDPGTDPDQPGTDEPGTDPDKPGTDEPGDTTDPGDQKPGDTTKPGGTTAGGSTSGGGLAQTGDPTSAVAALATALAGAGALVASRKRR